MVEEHQKPNAVHFELNNGLIDITNNLQLHSNFKYEYILD